MVLFQQIPSRNLKPIRLDATALVDALHGSIHVVAKRLSPGQISIAANHAMGGSAFKRLFRIECRMNPSKDNQRSALSRQAAHRVSAQCVAGVNTDTDDVAGLDCSRIQGFYSFIANNRIAELRRSGSGQDKKPSRRNDRRTESSIAGVDYMDLQMTTSARAIAINANTSRGLTG